MAERRSLSEGLKPSPQTAAVVDPQLEHEFVHGNKPQEPAPAVPANPSSRSPISTRIRSEYAVALKRASLQRQLEGVEPSSLQDILEEAIEPWLRSNGYIR